MTRTLLMMVALLSARNAAAMNYKTPAQFQTAFEKIAVNLTTHTTLPYPSAWSLSDHFESMLMTARLTNSTAYNELMIDQGYELTKVTSKARNEKDTFSGALAPVILAKQAAYSCSLPAAFLVHHGVTWAPIVEGIRDYLAYTRAHSVVVPSGRLAKIRAIVRTADAGLTYFKRQVTSVKGRKAYVLPTYTGSCLVLSQGSGKPVPLNMAAGPGKLALALDAYDTLVPNVVTDQTNNLAYAMNSIVPYLDKSRSGAISWDYMPNGHVEDTSHASLVISFLDRAYATQSTLRPTLVGIAKTFHATYSTGPDKVHDHIVAVSNDPVGTTKYAMGLARWVELARVDCTVWKKVEKIQTFQRRELVNGVSTLVTPFDSTLVGLMLETYRPYKCPGA